MGKKSGRGIPNQNKLNNIPGEGQNRLIFEKSPYLLQHARNPVDWYPWGDEAFAKAANEEKPIFLSIGYSTCHWCHVMERESFEDREVAALMNEGFVAIKVDREERPDVDNIYMTVCQMLTGGGGWPLTIVMTPDKKPFFAGTYFPKETRFERIGLMELLPRIRDIYTNRKNEVVESSESIVRALKHAVGTSSGEILDESILKAAFDQLSGMFDEIHGGFGDAPKFPTAHSLTFLLRYSRRTGDSRALEMVKKTLDAMRAGGIYDHVGFGFHRYSTGNDWLVPHFEKMLYDQALIAIAYTEAFQVTRNPAYAYTAQSILDYALRDMTAEGGGFFSAEDADSEGVEGKFYLWTAAEIKKTLPGDDANLIAKVFNIRPEGNFAEESTGRSTGENILNIRMPFKEIAEELKIEEPDLRERVDGILKLLFDVREKRVRPSMDDKILTDWNGLMIAALAKTGRALGNPKYIQAAERAADFILENMRDSDGALIHRYRDGEAALPSHLDDYAFFVWGLIELYEATFSVRYLRAALDLNDYMIAHFRDADNGGFYFTSEADRDSIARPKVIYDGAVPSGNSAAAFNLLRLGRITANTGYEDMAHGIARSFADQIKKAPAGHTQMLAALDFAFGPTFELVIVGKSGEADTEAMIKAVSDLYLPDAVAIFRPTNENDPEINRLAPYTKDFAEINRQSTAYLCSGHRCQLPVNDVKKITEMLKQTGT